MHHMTSDMGGAAAVIATVVLAAQLKLPVDVIATVPMAENMPSSTAQRPGDVLTQYGGITVEVLNTDAEGRLILADAIVRACEDEPDYLIETSTLTGAQTVALGARTPGVMGSDEFRDRVAGISQDVGENGWPMPLPEELKDDLSRRSPTWPTSAAQRFAGMLVAGVYLREFVADGVQWAHIDVAGPAYNTGGPWGYTGKGGTGCARRAPCSPCSRTSRRTARPGSALEFLAQGALALDAPTCVVITHPLRVADLLHVVDGDLQLPGQPPGVALAAGLAAGPLAVAGHEHDGQIGDRRLGLDEAFDPGSLGDPVLHITQIGGRGGPATRRGRVEAGRTVPTGTRSSAGNGVVSLSIVPDS